MEKIGWLPGKSRIVEQKRIEGMLYLRRLVPCGKKHCKACPHGPYWYVQIRKGGTLREIYIGKHFKTLEQKNLEDKIKRGELRYESARNPRG